MERIRANVIYWSMLRIRGTRRQFSNVAIAMANGHGIPLLRCSMLEFGYVGAGGKVKEVFRLPVALCRNRGCRTSGVDSLIAEQ